MLALTLRTVIFDTASCRVGMCCNYVHAVLNCWSISCMTHVFCAARMLSIHIKPCSRRQSCMCYIPAMGNSPST